MCRNPLLIMFFLPMLVMAQNITVIGGNRLFCLGDTVQLQCPGTVTCPGRENFGIRITSLGECGPNCARWLDSANEQQGTALECSLRTYRLEQQSGEFKVCCHTSGSFNNLDECSKGMGSHTVTLRIDDKIPTAPLLTNIEQVSCNGLNITWETDDEVEYRIRGLALGEEPCAGPHCQFARDQVSPGQFNFTSLDAPSYLVGITASSCRGDASNFTTITTKSFVPAVTAINVTRHTCDTVDVRWSTDRAMPANYSLYANSEPDAVCTTIGNNCTVSVGGMDDDEGTLKWQLIPAGECGEGPSSEATIDALTLSPPPGGLTAYVNHQATNLGFSGGVDTVQLSWTAPLGNLHSGYQLQWDNGQGSTVSPAMNFRMLPAGATGTTVNVSPGQYRFRLTARYDGQNRQCTSQAQALNINVPASSQNTFYAGMGISLATGMIVGGIVVGIATTIITYRIIRRYYQNQNAARTAIASGGLPPTAAPQPYEIQQPQRLITPEQTPPIYAELEEFSHTQTKVEIVGDHTYNLLDDLVF